MKRDEAERRVMDIVCAAVAKQEDFDNVEYDKYFDEQKEKLINALCGEHSEGKPANGKSPFAEMQGKWPGDETAEELLDALKEPSVIQDAVKDGVSFEFYTNISPEDTKAWSYFTAAKLPFVGAKKFRAVEVEP